MASRFVLTAQVQLQAPTNTRQVVNQIQRQLSGVNMQVNLQGGQQAAKQVNNLNKATKQATTQANKMGKAFGASIRRFGAFTIATRAVSLFSNSLANATKDAIDFQREMIKISQVTGKTMAQLKGLENTITELATSLGVSSKSILSVGRILSQAGIQAKDLEVALKALAKTELAPTFDDITKTAEGAVAILAQFGEGVGALERQLGAINAVAGQFAVESGDLISAVRRTGGVFKAAGGDLEELLALFTSVRATTRESAESIATGLRTIFTRIQRPATIEFLKQFGVELTDLNGKFVGPYEAIRQLSTALSGLQEGDIRFVRIAEELGGFRQIGKVIPLLQQFETAERARQAALEGGNSLNDDAAKAQAALAVQITKVKEEFLALIRSISQTASFQTFVKTSLELASALIKVADALKPLIPLLATFGAIKFARGAAGFARGIGAGLKGAGSPTGFARGGMVPGTGNRDTVPAMLTPGEFVIRKSSVSKLGAGTLAAMNENRFNRGARIKKELDTQRGSTAFDFKKGATIQAGKGGSGTLKAALSQADLFADADNYQAVFLRPEARGKQFKGQILKSNLDKAIKEALSGTGISSKQVGVKQIADRYASKNKFNLTAGSLTAQESGRLESTLLDGIDLAARKGAKEINGSLGIQGEKNIATALRSANIDQVLGNLFEVVLTNAGAPFGKPDTDPPNAPFDFPSGLGKVAKNFGLKTGIKTEAKSFFSESNLATINKKVQNELINESVEELRGIYRNFLSGQGKPISLSDAKKAFGSTKLGVGDITRLAEQQGLNFNAIGGGKYSLTRRNAGGSIAASDTVPALLTPGEFVFNKRAAQSIGYSNLSRMNTKGVQGFANGGIVGMNEGGLFKPITGKSASQANPEVQALVKSIDNQVVATEESTTQQKENIKEQKKNSKKQQKTSASGSRLTGAGQALLFAAGSLGTFIPKVEGATEGMGALQNSIADSVTQIALLAGIGSQFGPLGTAVGLAAGGMMAVVDAIDAYKGVHEEARKTIEEGNVAEAGQAAVASQAQKDVNKMAIGAAAAGAAIGSIVPGVGTAVGALVGGAVGLVAKFNLTEGALAAFRDNILTLFGGQSTAQIKALAAAEAAATRETKALADASAKASEAMKSVEDGSQTIGEAFKSGAFTAGLKAVAEGNTARIGTARKLGKDSAEQAGKAGLGAIALGFGAKTALATGTLGLSAAAEGGARLAGVDTPSSGDIGDKILEGLGFDSASARVKKALEKASEEEAKIREENNKKLAAQLTSPVFKQGFDELVKSTTGTAAAMGRSIPTLNDIIGKMGDEGKLVQEALDLNPELREKFEKQVTAMGEAAKENAAFLKSLNFGLKDVTSGITAFNTNLDNITESSKSGYNSLTVATNTLAAVVSGAGNAISQADLDSSLDSISSSFAAFGATESQINTLTGTVRGFNDAQKNANGALQSLKDNLRGVDLAGAGNLEAVQEDFTAALLGSIPDSSPIKERLTSAFNGIGKLTKEEIEQFYNTGDAGPILEKAFGPVGEQIEKQILGPSKELESANAKLIKATEERRGAELKLIEVQKKAIDLQIEAGKNLEFFGGAKFTPEKEFAARRQQANLSLSDAGVRGLTTGNARDIRRAGREVFSRFSGQQQAQNIALQASGGTRGAFGDRAGVDTDRRPELKKANEALLQVTKQGIEQRKKELELIQKKNQAEKDALDSLLGGDIESFFEKSSAAAAGAALRTGNAAAASLFSAGSLGRGLQGLQGTGISDAENKRAAQLAFGSFGLGNRAAEVFTGTTAEEERIKAEGRELSQLQSDLAGQMGDMEAMNVTAKQVIINTQDAKFSEIQSRVQQNQAVLGLRKGGPVYASTGMFVPRGTDTVPAMLTPGEFVVNRAAVQRGNNLQILRAMNGGMGTGATNAAGTPTLNRGGIFGGGRTSAPSFEMPDFSSVFTKFSEAVDKLAGLNISVKLDTTNVNVNLNGGSFLSTLDEKIRTAVLQEVSKETGRLAFNEAGDIKATNRSVLG